MKNLKAKYGDWALVTGASSGMGAIFSKKLAAAGMNVVLVARRKERLEKLAKELNETNNVQTRVVCADLSNEQNTKELIAAVDDLQIGLLVNNAGFANTGDFLDNKLEDEINLLDTNCKAALILTHALGNKMKQKKQGAIVFLSSLLSVTAVSKWAAYAASKGFVLQFSEALAEELKNYNVDVMALCPGFTRTEFIEISKFNNLIAMDAEKVVNIALAKLGKRRVVVPGLINKFNFFVTRLTPRWINTKLFSLIVSSTQKSASKA